METVEPDAGELIDLVTAVMPFGKYKGRLLIDLPEAYLVWFSNKGWPTGKLGLQLYSLYEIRSNGLGHIIREVRRRVENSFN